MKISTFLTFVNDQCGKAEEAMHFYISVFPNSEIKSVSKFAEGDPGGQADLIKHGIFTLNGVEYMISENTYNHKWGITPGVSLFIVCDTEAEIDDYFAKLSEGGQVMLPLGNYESEGFGKKFGWCADKYGVNWQLQLAA